MKSYPLGWGIVLVLSLISTHKVIAQSKIPYDVVTTSSALSGPQQQSINTFVADKVSLLNRDIPGEVVQARKALMEPLAWAGGTNIFHLAYSSAVSHRLVKAISSDLLHVRLNTIIVVNALVGPGVVDLVKKGLNDPNPAVRYWAAMAVDRTGKSTVFSQNEQSELLNTLVIAMRNETSERVYQRLLVGLVGLDIPEAADRLLENLNNRVSQHAVNPSLSLEAAFNSLRNLFVKTIRAKSNNQSISNEFIRKLALVAYRYLVLASTLIETHQSTLEDQAHYAEMVKLTDAVLRWTLNHLSSEESQPPPSISEEIVLQNWPLIRLRTEEWKQILMNAPFNFDPMGMNVPVKD